MDRLRKSSKTMRRALAALLAFAMSLSPVAVPATSDAAAKKPALNAKKKTLFFNQAGKKSFTLKIKKNKNIKVKKTTWKTTNKKVASISSKKKTAVKVTAKKAGKATIKATVNYTLKGSKKVKKTTLTCKVTSKSYTAPVQTVVPSAAPSASASAPAATATATTAPTTAPSTEPTTVPTTAPTAEPTSEPTTAPTAEPTAEPTTEPTAEPTSEPTVAPTATPQPAVATKIVLDQTEVTVGVAEKKNTATLKATVKDQNDKEMKDQTIVWSSDKEEVATVKDGVVTGVKAGEAVITATVGKIKAECKVKVDTTSAKIVSAEFTDYKTITLTLDKEIEGTIVAKVDGKELSDTQVASINAENAKAVVIKDSKAFLGNSTYEIALSGATDKFGNALEASYSLKKEKSYVASYEFVSTGFASGTATATINYTAKDQYGEDKTGESETDSTVTVSATLGTNAMPLTAAKGANGTITVTNTAAYAEGQEINVVIKTTVDNVVKATEEKSFVAGKVAAAKSITAVRYTNALVANVEAKAVSATNLTADVRDQYNNKMTLAALTWKSSDASVVSFDASKAQVTATSDSNQIDVYGLKEGTATISAYLSDGTVCGTPLTVVVKAGEVNTITYAGGSFDSISKATGTTINVNPAKKDGKYITVTDKNGAEIKLKASDVTFDVASDDNAQSTWKNSFVTVTPVSDADGYLTAFTVATKLTGRDASAKDQASGAAGTYTIKVNAKKADGSKVTANITTYAKYDEKVASISFGPTTSVVAGGTIRNAITFKNQYDECVPVKAKDIKTAYADEDGKFNVTLNKYDYSTKAEDDDYVGTILVKATSSSYAAASVGNHEITFVVGTKTATMNVTVTAAPSLKTISLGTSKVDLISGNTLSKGISSEDVVEGYTLVPVTFTDNNGQAGVVKVTNATNGELAMVSNESQYYSLKPVQKVKNSGADIPKLSVKYYDKDKKVCGNYGNEVKYIGFNNTVDTTATSKVQLKYVYAFNAKAEVITDEITINTNKARALKDLSVKGDVTTAVVDQDINLTFAGVDQYGEKIALTEETTMNPTANVTYNDGKIQASKAGKYTVTFKNGSISKAYTFTVIDKTAVDKIVIQPTVKSDNVNYDSTKYLVKVVNGKSIVASVKAYASDVEVAIDPADITYTFKATKATNDSTLAVESNGTVTTAGEGSIEISATQTFSTTTIAPVTVKVSAKDAVATTNTSFATLKDGVYTNIENVSVKKGTANAEGSTTVYLHATDQYGKDFVYTVEAGNFTLIGAPVGATASVSDNAITITSAKNATSAAGKTTLRVVLGVDVYDVPVTIA